MRNVILCVFIALLAVSCNYFAGEAVDVENTYEVDNTSTISVSNISGDITIVPSVDGQITVKAHITPYFPNGDAYAVDIVAVTGSNFVVYADYDSFNSVSVDFEIHIPETVSLKAVENTTGDIVAYNINSIGYISTTTGSLSVTNITGQLEAYSTTGSIDLVNVETITGIYITTGDIFAQIMNTPQKDIEIESTTGSVEIEVKSNVSAVFRAEVTTGEIDLPLFNIAEYDGSVFEGAYNGGGNKIEISTTTGDVEIEIASF